MIAELEDCLPVVDGLPAYREALLASDCKAAYGSLGRLIELFSTPLLTHGEVVLAFEAEVATLANRPVASLN